MTSQRVWEDLVLDLGWTEQEYTAHNAPGLMVSRDARILSWSPW